MQVTDLAAHLLRDLPEVLAHSRRVADRAPLVIDHSVALLHDVLEDTDVDPVLLEAIVGRDIFRSVVVLTRLSTETYAEYIQRVAASGDSSAIKVKVADLYDHLALTATLRPSLATRYQRALDVLLPLVQTRGPYAVRRQLRRSFVAQ
jgi:(p)ppGpp synthase/HD superfamily hydrolase